MINLANKEIVGRTFWDALHEFWQYGVFVIIIIIVVAVLCYIIAHPNIAREWNQFFVEIKATFIPKSRKNSFQKKLNNTVSSAILRFEKSFPTFKSKFLPYSLKIEWIGVDEDVTPLIKDKQAIFYINNFKDEEKQTATVVYEYVDKCFAETTKYYFSENESVATNILVTRKVLQKGKPNVLKYYERNLINEYIKGEEMQRIFDRFSDIGNAGLFLPIFMNELEKFTSGLYPTNPTEEISDVIKSFADFVYKIANKEPGEKVETYFPQLSVRVILAVGKSFKISTPLKRIENDMKKQVKTTYIIASGSKNKYAKIIAEKAYYNNLNYFEEPIKISCERKSGNYINPVEAVCYELNKIDNEN